MKKLLLFTMIASTFALTACGDDTPDATVAEPATEITVVTTEASTEAPTVAPTEAVSTRELLQTYVNERGAGIAGGFEAREMNDTATVTVAGDESVLISITLEDEFVISMAVTLDFLLATLEEEIASVMPIFSEEAGNVEADLNIDGFHFTIEFLLSTGDVLAWQSIYPSEVMGIFMSDLSFLEIDEPETTQTTVGDVTTIEFDGITVNLSEPFVMTSDEFRSEFPDWIFDLGTHYRWLLVYVEITNETSNDVNFGNRPFYITDEFEDLDWQSTSIDRLNGTGFDTDGVIAVGETLSGYVPFIVTRHSSTFEIDVRPLFVDQLGSPFAGRFIFTFEVEMD